MFIICILTKNYPPFSQTYKQHIGGIETPKVDQHTGRNMLIHGTEYRNITSYTAWTTPVGLNYIFPHVLPYLEMRRNGCPKVSSQ